MPYLYNLTAIVTRSAEYLRDGKLPGTALLSVSLEDGDAAPAGCIVLDRYPDTGSPLTVVLVATLGSGAGQYAVEGGGPGGPP